MDPFLHDILHILVDLQRAVEIAMKKIEDLATKEILNKRDEEDVREGNATDT